MEGLVKRPQAFTMRVRIYSDDDTPQLINTNPVGLQGAFMSGSKIAASNKTLGEAVGLDDIVYCSMAADGTFQGVTYMHTVTTPRIRNVRVIGGLSFSGNSSDKNRLRMTCRFTYLPSDIKIYGDLEFSASVPIPSVGGLQQISIDAPRGFLNGANTPESSVPCDGIYTCYSTNGLGGMNVGLLGGFLGTRTPSIVTGILNGTWEVENPFYYGDASYGFIIPTVSNSTGSEGSVSFSYGYTCGQLLTGPLK